MKLNKLLAALTLTLAAGGALADTATVSATGSVQAGCQFANSTFTVNLPATNTVTLNNGTAITQPAALQIQCSSGVSASLNLGAMLAQDVDVDGDGSMDLEARLFSGTACNSGAWPVSVTATGAPQDVQVCVHIVKKAGVDAPPGTISASWPINLTIN